jgi:hypothetical protein
MTGNSPKVASLTSTLLAVKGDANAHGFTPRHAPLPQRAAAPRSSRSPAKQEGEAELTLRLDATQLRRLRLAAAHLDHTEHGFLIAALEHYIDHVVSPLLDGRCACLETEHKPLQVASAALAFARPKSDLPQ